MSFARWSEHSDVYVYEDCTVGLVCCGCCLYDDNDPHAAFGCSWASGADVEAMAGHLRSHEARGHLVPADVYPALIEWAREVIAEGRKVPAL